LVVQAIESFLLTPLIESRSSGLHPVTTVVALLIGGKLAGLLGMLLAIPIASTLKSLGAEWVLPEVRRLAKRAAAGEPPPPATEANAADVAVADGASNEPDETGNAR
ncbi:MAG: AI-2E family transporter, partial [Planctomycetota bacterium]